MNPIGYVAMMKLPGGDPWEPAALTKYADDAARQLLVRTCFSMFPTESAAEDAVRDLQGQSWVPGVEVRICAVFPSNIAAPHGAEHEEPDPDPLKTETRSADRYA